MLLWAKCGEVARVVKMCLWYDDGASTRSMLWFGAMYIFYDFPIYM